MSVEMHLDYFPITVGTAAKNREKGSHQNRQMEERYQGYRDVNMLADYCWC